MKISTLTKAAAVLAILLSLPACNRPDVSRTKPMDAGRIARQFENPDNRYRPYVRWWWNGDRVCPEELIRELHVMKDAGIGGVEISPIEFPSGADSLDCPALTWLSDEWMDCLQTVFRESKRLGMDCDLLVGSGWPFGSESLKPEERASILVAVAKPLAGGLHHDIKVEDLIQEGTPAVTIVNPDMTSELVSLLLVPDPIGDLSEATDVKGQVKDGILSLDAPKGDFQLHALIRYDSFASVINGAPGAAGSQIDYMNATAIRDYLDHMADAIEARTGPLSKHLRAFFVDNMELEGCDWTSDFAEEFQKRRGYDIMPWFPFILFKMGRLGDVSRYSFGGGKTPAFQEQVERARYDFEITRMELNYERYTRTFLAWCREKGVQSRAQAYGRGFWPLDSSLDYDIPEGESWTTNWLRHRVGEEMGDEDYRRGRAYTMVNKYVSSAAHIAGKRVVSAEEMTNTYLVFRTTLEFLKVGSDMAAFSGITHSVWHGFNYSPPEAPFPGWVQYGTFHNERNTWWPYVRQLNDYRARMSAVLQNVDMVTPIAILPANGDLWSELGAQNEPFPVKLNTQWTSILWEAIHKNGGGADYVSEGVLRDASVVDGRLVCRTRAYEVLFLAGLKGIDEATLDKVDAFVRGGGRVFCVGDYPCKSLGLKDFEARDAAIQARVAALVRDCPERFVRLDLPEVAGGPAPAGRTATVGKPATVGGPAGSPANVMAGSDRPSPAQDADETTKQGWLEWYGDVMRRYDLPHDVTVTRPDRFLLQNHYRGDDGTDWFLLANASFDRAQETDLIFSEAVVPGGRPASGKTVARHNDGNSATSRDPSSTDSDTPATAGASCPGRQALLYNPNDGKRYTLEMSGDTLHLRLGPSETVLIAFQDRPVKAPAWHPAPLPPVSDRQAAPLAPVPASLSGNSPGLAASANPVPATGGIPDPATNVIPDLIGDPITLRSAWQVTLVNPQVDSVIRFETDPDESGRLPDLKDTHPSFMGTATYRTTFTLPATAPAPEVQNRANCTGDPAAKASEVQNKAICTADPAAKAPEVQNKANCTADPAAKASEVQNEPNRTADPAAKGPEVQNKANCTADPAAKAVEAGQLPQWLHLGKVCDIAEVRVNGQPAGLRWWGDPVFDISGLLHPGENELEIQVTTLMCNYMRTLTDNSAARRFTIRRNHEPVSAGLLGPVTLY